jgi:hypothetical protein
MSHTKTLVFLTRKEIYKHIYCKDVAAKILYPIYRKEKGTQYDVVWVNAYTGMEIAHDRIYITDEQLPNWLPWSLKKTG